MKIKTPIALLSIIIIVGVLVVLAVGGGQAPTWMISECVVGFLLILIIMSLHDQQTNGDADGSETMSSLLSEAEIQMEEEPVKIPLDELLASDQPRTVAMVEDAVEVKKELLAGNLEDPEPEVKPEKETAHVKTEEEMRLDNAWQEEAEQSRFAPIPLKIPATSRQLYGDVYSFCEQLPLKTLDEIGKKMDSWGRKYSMVSIQPEGMYILVDGAGSHYSIRIPQFGYFKTAK